MPISHFLPNVELLLRLEPEELAIPLLRYLIEQELQPGILHEDDFLKEVSNDEYSSGESKPYILKKLLESWAWLEKEGLVAQFPLKEKGWVYITEKGKSLAKEIDVKVYKRSNLLPRETLDPALASKIYHLFLRGEYDMAVFQAFKEVENRVREASSLSQETTGTNLIREAFNSKNNKLTNETLKDVERQAISDLFSGAINLFTNLSKSHHLEANELNECIELIYLANHLLRILGRSDIKGIGESSTSISPPPS